MNYKELQKEITLDNGVFRNFTGRYLLPQLKLLEGNPLDKLDGRYVKAFALCDRKYEHYNEFDNKLFVLMSMKADLNYWMDNYEYYLYQDGMADKLGIIFDLPVNNRAAFLEGRYSELYINKDIIPKYSFSNGIQSITSAWGVINKTEEAREAFENKVNKDFALNPKIIITEEQEYEYPPVMSREIFNV